MIRKILLIAAMLLGAIPAEAQQNPDINDAILQLMEVYHVPVAGYAIIKNYRVVLAETLSIDPRLKVSKNSLFQAASISKSLAAYGALKLVSERRLSLDEPVNQQLKSWKIPENQYSKNTPVTLTQLLDMTSGLSVSGFPGHVQGEKLPTLLEVLEGKIPANTPPVRLFYRPGTRYFYTGGGFQVLEQLMEDITGQSFTVWMQREILHPLNMRHSLFQTPLEKQYHPVAVPGFLSDGSPIKGGWNHYAIAAAGGMWSTPSDLAKFAINISESWHGKNNRIIPKTLTEKMLTRQKNTDYGLGVVINGKGRHLNFRKAGHNLGYHSQIIMFPNSGDGLVIMTNSENGGNLINYLIPLIAQKYHWPCFFPCFDELVEIPEKACLVEDVFSGDIRKKV